MNDQASMTDQQLNDEIDTVIREFLDMQINCIMLQYAGCIEMRQGKMENGLIMLEAVREMRELLEKQRKNILTSIGEESINHACDRIGFEKILYSSISDAVLKANMLCFNLKARPQGPEYACDEQKCNLNVRIKSLEYFPELLAPAA